MTEDLPRFTARLTAFDENRRKQLESAAGGGLLPSEQHMVLEDHLRTSLIRRNTFLPLFKLQMNLLQDLVLAEKAIAAYKERIEEHKEKISVDDPGREKLQEELPWMQRELHFHEAERRAIRDIADGIAWRLFDYDRAVLHELANRPGKKHINLEGIAAEVHEFGQVFNSREGIAVLNDLTNFLKLGDITIRKDSGTFEMVEVKGGTKKSGRIARQKQHLRQTVDFFNAGEQETDKGRFVITELDVTPETFHPHIRRIIEKAQDKGSAVDRIGDHLIVDCTDFPKSVEYDIEEMRKIMGRARDWAEDWQKTGDVVRPFLSQDKYLVVRYFAPCSIFPYPEIVRVKLMTGALWLHSYVNLSAVLRYLEQKGWKLIKSPNEHFEEIERIGTEKSPGWATVRKGPLTSELPWGWLGRLGYEFLKPRTLLNALEAHLAAGSSDAAMIFPNFSGEFKVWD